MDVEALLATMTPEIYQRLMTAVELGKWPDGVALTPEQQANCMQMVMLWQSRHNSHPEHMSIGTDGQITMKSKRALLEELKSSTVEVLKPQ